MTALRQKWMFFWRRVYIMIQIVSLFHISEKLSITEFYQLFHFIVQLKAISCVCDKFHWLIALANFIDWASACAFTWQQKRSYLSNLTTKNNTWRRLTDIAAGDWVPADNAAVGATRLRHWLFYVRHYFPRSSSAVVARNVISCRDVISELLLSGHVACLLCHRKLTFVVWRQTTVTRLVDRTIAHLFIGRFIATSV